MLISAASSDLLFGLQEVLIDAKHLLGTPGIYEQSGGEVTYIHLLFDRHKIVFANDVPSESFFPGEPALIVLEDAVRNEVLSLYPELKNRTNSNFASTARLCISHAEALLLVNTL